MPLARALVVAVIVASPSVSFAQPSVQAAMDEYFSGEKIGGGVLIGMGATGLTAGALLYADGGDHARGASYPLLGFGAIHVAAGVFVAVSSHRRQKAFRVRIATEESAFVADETARMQRVKAQLFALKVAEIALIGGGVALAGVGWWKDRDQIEGAGLALAAEAAATLVFDLFAARRAERYLGRLTLHTGSDPASGERTGLLVYRASY